MNGITRYILWQLGVGLVLVVAGLCGVVWLSQSLRFVDMIVNRGLSAFDFVRMTMLLLPNFIPFILPFALFIVILFVYSKLINDREIVVMRAAGMSHLSLSRPALTLAVIVVLICYAFTLYLLPNAFRMFRELQWDLRNNYSHLVLREGAFNTINEDLTVYVRERARDGQLLGLLFHDNRDAERPVTIMAARGALVQTDNGPHVVVFDGSRQEVDRATHKLSILKFDRYTLDLEQARHGATIRYREARERPIGELFDAFTDDTVNPKDYGKFLVEAHQRLATPWSAVGFAMIALACLLTGNVPRGSQFRRVLMAIGLFAAVQLANMGLQNLAAKNLSLVFTLYLATLLPIAAAGYVLLRPSIVRHAAAPAARAG